MDRWSLVALASSSAGSNQSAACSRSRSPGAFWEQFDYRCSGWRGGPVVFYFCSCPGVGGWVEGIREEAKGGGGGGGAGGGAESDSAITSC